MKNTLLRVFERTWESLTNNPLTDYLVTHSGAYGKLEQEKQAESTRLTTSRWIQERSHTRRERDLLTLIDRSVPQTREQFISQQLTEKTKELKQSEQRLEKATKQYDQTWQTNQSLSEKVESLEQELEKQKAAVAAYQHVSPTAFKEIAKKLKEFRASHSRNLGFLIVDGNGIIRKNRGKILKNLGYGSGTLTGRNYEDILGTVDRQRFTEAIRRVKATPEYTGFELGAGLVNINDQGRHLLSHYRVSVSVEREANPVGNIQLMTIILGKEDYEWNSQPTARTIAIPKRKDIDKRKLEELASAINETVEKRERITLDFRYTERLPEHLKAPIGKLLGSNYGNAIGLKNLTDRDYTLLRDPSLEVPIKKLGIREVTYKNGNEKTSQLPQPT